jgi:polyisoprenoid-binding protein YceI
MATQTETRIPTGTWRSDPTHSEIGFEIRHVVGTFRGSFGDFEVTLSADGGGARISGAVRVDSIRVDDEQLYGHLLSPDFFDSARYPRIAFESGAVRADDDGITVAGELALKDTRKEVEVRGRITEAVAGLDGKRRIGIDLSDTLDRTEIGLDWNTELPQGGTLLGDEVTVNVHLELVEEA